MLLAIALVVKLTSPGPVFYVQKRLGRRYRRFGCIKFRTMQLDADRRLADLLASSPALRAEYAQDHKLRRDPRITPVGQLLRVTSLDELPQLINILRGEMSVVGPRPIVQAEVSRYGPAMDAVLSVRPGLTGLWQVSGRNNLDYPRRVALDVQYVSRPSLRRDFAILCSTIGVVLWPSDNGAY
jgi:lipopolysaccharide/colanic/teichoic acid biosynthesis glycosyltransferase